MTFANLGFELEGAKPGTALGWTQISKATAEELAGFRENVAASVSRALNDASKWATSDATVLANAFDPTGGSNAFEIHEIAGVSIHGIMDLEAQTARAGKPLTFGAWLKAGTNSYAFVGYATGFGGAGVFVDLLNARVLEPVQPADAIETMGVQVGLYADGWMRIECSITPVGDSQTVSPVLLLSRDGTTIEYDEAGLGRYVLAWCPYIFEGAIHDCERFEIEWNNVGFVSSFEDPELELASYATSFATPHAFESFESGWQNYPYLYEIAAAESLAVEGFAAGWDNDAYRTTIFVWESATGTPDAFSWNALLTVLTPGVDCETMTDPGTGESYEQFYPVVDDFEISADPATDTLNADTIPVWDGLRVQVVNITGQMPAGIYSTRSYFVVSKNPTNFKVSLTEGGAAVDITTRETGKLIARMVPECGWNGPMILPTL